MKWTIRLKMMLFTFCIVLLAGGGISGYFILEGQRAILRTFENRGKEIASLIAGTIVSDLYFLDIALLRHRLRSGRANPDIAYTYVTDVNGILLSDGTTGNRARDARLTDPFSVEILQADGWISRKEGELLKVGGPVSLPDGKRIGYLQVGFSLHRVTELLDQTTRVSLYATMICLGLGGMLSVLVARHFSQPISSLVRVAEEIAAERFETRSTVKRRDELGRLANAINVMVEGLERRQTEIRHAAEELRALAGKLLSAQEEERARLARELHDDLTQRLAVLAMEAGTLEQSMGSLPARVLERLRQMRDQLVSLSADVHAMARQLHPSILDDLGLVKAIESECIRFSEREGIRVWFEPTDVPAELPKDVALCLYRIAHESLRNIAKHAQAKEAHVSLVGRDGEVLLSIRDEGIGFDRAQVRGKAGLGLASMEERVRLIQGEMAVRSRPGQGTRIVVRAPLGRRDA